MAKVGRVFGKARVGNGLLAILCAIAAAITTPVWLLTGWPVWLCVTLSGLLWLMIWLYVATMRRGALRYQTVYDWQDHVEPDQGRYMVPERHFDRLRPNLIQSPDGEEKENEVKIVYRQHWLKLAQSLALPAFGILISLIGMFWIIFVYGGSLSFGDRIPTYNPPAVPTRIPWVIPETAVQSAPATQPPISFGDPNSSRPVADAALHWWVFLFVIAALVLVGWMLSWKWLYTYRIVTNMRIIIATAPPPFPLPLPFISAKTDNVQLSMINTAHDETRGLGNLFGVGTVGLDTVADVGDLDFNNIPFTPDPLAVARIISGEAAGARRRHEGTAL